MCTWYLETEDTKPVQSVAVTLSYSERGNSLPSSSVDTSFACLGNPKGNDPGKMVYHGVVYLIGVFLWERGGELVGREAHVVTRRAQSL